MRKSRLFAVLTSGACLTLTAVDWCPRHGISRYGH